VTGGSEEEGPGEVGGAFGNDPWSVGDDDAPFAAEGEVDVVEADGVVADSSELGADVIEEFGIDLVVVHRDDDVGTADEVQEFGAGEFVVFSLLGRGTGDKNFAGHGVRDGDDG
jgi:hypothetical protein